jgi:hypothetical protein
MRRVTALLVLAAVMLVGAACGDDDEGLTKSQYVSKGNAICKTSDDAFNRLFETDFPSIPEKVPAFFEKAVPIVEKEVDDMRALDPPEADEETIEAMLALGEKSVTDFEKATKDSEFGVELFTQEGGENSREFHKKAVAYGMGECGEDDEGESTPKLDPATFSPEKRAYVDKADAICKKADAKSDPVEESMFASFPPALQQWAKGLPQLVAIVRTEVAEFEALAPPAADKATIAAIIAQEKDTLDKLDRGARLAVAGDADGFAEAVGPIFGTFEEIDGKLKAYGFQFCGSEDDDE